MLLYKLQGRRQKRMGRFLHNKYSKWYFNLMVKVENRTCLLSGEKHHIIPKSMGGSNDEANIALLTFREHFIAHMLLTKFCARSEDQRKMLNALGSMQRKHLGHKSRILNSRQFEIVRKAISLANKGRSYGPRSEEIKQKIGLGHKGKKLSDDHKQKLSEWRLGRPSGIKPMLGRRHSDE